MNLPGATLLGDDIQSNAEPSSAHASAPAGTAARKRCSRQPLAGVALAAVGGILLADWLDGNFWVALGGFLALALGFVVWRRRAWVFWLAAVAAFAALHLFYVHQPGTETLARLLPDSPREPAQRVEAVGVVTSEPRISASGVARFTFDLERITLDGYSWDNHARVMAYWQNGSPKFGDRVEILGVARNLLGPRNPGEFDFAAYLRRRGIRSEIRCSGLTDVRTLQPGSAGWRRAAAQRFHDWMRDTLNLGLDNDPTARAIVPTMLLGLKESPGLGDLKDVFQRTGTLHYFAIDGLKLALLSALALWAMAYSGLSRAWAGLLSLPLLVFYALATGLGPASLRSALTAAALLSAYWLERRLRPLNALGAAAALTLIFNTNQLFDLGFQLTFAVVLALILLVKPLHDWIMRFGAPDPFLPRQLYSFWRRIWERPRFVVSGLISVSLVAWAASLPLMIWYFHVVSPISPLANVAVFPLVGMLLVLNVVSLAAAGVLSVFGPIVPGAWTAAAACAAHINRFNAFTAKFLLLTVQWFDAAPGGHWRLPDPAEWTLRAPPAAEITVLDLGRARAMHLRVGKQDWLIDCGQPYEYTQSIRLYLHYRGISRLTGLIFSQADTYHISGAPFALDDFLPARFIDSDPAPGRSPRRKEFVNLLNARHLHIENFPQDGVMSVGTNAELRAFYPPPGMKSGTSADRALVMQLRAAGWRVLLMADAGQNVERALLQGVSAEALHSDALVSGATPAVLTPEFLHAVAPHVIISQHSSPIGYSSPPLPQTEPPFRWQRVDDSGAIRLRLYPKRMECSGFVDGSEVVIPH